jgi:uncharacterized alpha-E superfamily protein
VVTPLAASVFRLGRAVERPDLVARLLDVHLQRLGPEPSPGERVVCRELRAVTGATAIDDPVALTAGATLDALAVDRHETASIAAAVATARDLARRAREVVSTELWDCLDTTRARMPRKIASERAHEFLGWAWERSALAVGIVASDAARDEVWESFTLGRSLERAAVTARMLASDLLDPGSASSWTLALRATGAAEAFQRAEHGPVRAAEAAAFLLLDDRCPRAVRFVLDRASECLDDVAPASVDDEVAAFEAVRADLVDLPPGRAVDALRDLTTRLVAATERLATALDDRAFADPARA